MSSLPPSIPSHQQGFDGETRSEPEPKQTKYSCDQKCQWQIASAQVNGQPMILVYTSSDMVNRFKLETQNILSTQTDKSDVNSSILGFGSVPSRHFQNELSFRKILELNHPRSDHPSLTLTRIPLHLFFQYPTPFPQQPISIPSSQHHGFVVPMSKRDPLSTRFVPNHSSVFLQHGYHRISGVVSMIQTLHRIIVSQFQDKNVAASAPRPCFRTTIERNGLELRILKEIVEQWRKIDSDLNRILESCVDLPGHLYTFWKFCIEKMPQQKPKQSTLGLPPPTESKTTINVCFILQFM